MWGVLRLTPYAVVVSVEVVRVAAHDLEVAEPDLAAV